MLCIEEVRKHNTHCSGCGWYLRCHRHSEIRVGVSALCSLCSRLWVCSRLPMASLWLRVTFSWNATIAKIPFVQSQKSWNGRQVTFCYVYSLTLKQSSSEITTAFPSESLFLSGSGPASQTWWWLDCLLVWEWRQQGISLLVGKTQSGWSHIHRVSCS